jgi:membrane-associated protease RseP (regulator of RpoE activity)
MRRFILFALFGTMASATVASAKPLPPPPKPIPIKPQPWPHPWPHPWPNPYPIIVPVYPRPIVVVDSPIVTTPVVATEWGMLITEETRTGPASAAGMRVNDIILNVGGMRTQTFDQLANALATVGPVEVVFFNSESKQTEKTMVTPVNGRIGVTAQPVEVR